MAFDVKVMFSQTILNLEYLFVLILFIIYYQLYITIIDSRQEAKKKKIRLPLVYFFNK